MPRSRPINERGRATIAVLAATAVAVVAVAVWFFFIRDNAPEAFSIEDAIGDAGGEDEEPLESVEGTWTVAATGPGDVPSEAGYRVDEELVDFGAKTVVGRTSDVVGALTIEGTTVTAVTVTVDMHSVVTDSAQRDNRYRAALEVDRFPTSNFVLTEPIELDSVPEPGEHVSVVAQGELTVHGVTRAVAATLDASLSGSTLVVVGSIPVTFADFGVEKPSAAIVLSLDDRGVVEFKLFLRQD